MSVVLSGDTVAGRYRLEATVAAGGMGVVWRATDLELRREVAIKSATTGDMRREARIGAGLQHPNVIMVFDVVTADEGTRLLVMEYLPSRTLAQVLREDGPLTPNDAALIGAQVADALGAMHAKGMVHRDITPSNILLAEDGTAKLTDLGIATWANVTQTGSSLIPGTPGYIAPEVAAGGVASPASDMYALGITLSNAVEGGEEENDDSQDTGQDERSSWFGVVLSALTHPNPKRRPSAARAREMLLDVSTAATNRRPRRVSRRLLAAVGAVLLVAVTVAGVLVWQRLSTDNPVTNASLIGDPRTVDPCGFIDKAPLARFGRSTLQSDFGEYNRCDILVYPDNTDRDIQLWVKVETGPESAEGTWDLSLKGGPIKAVYPPPQSSDTCTRIVVLPERYRVEVWAKNEDGAPGDLCAMADALLTHVLQVVYSGALPRIPLRDHPSIATVDACTLLEPADLDRVIGQGELSPDPRGYATWGCSWTGTRAVSGVWIELLRDYPVDTGAYGPVSKVGDRTAAVDSSGNLGADSCVIRVVHRAYNSNGLEGKEGVPKTEQFRLHVGSDNQALPMDQLCERAKKLAEVIVTRLPR